MIPWQPLIRKVPNPAQCGVDKMYFEIKKSQHLYTPSAKAGGFLLLTFEVEKIEEDE